MKFEAASSEAAFFCLFRTYRILAYLFGKKNKLTQIPEIIKAHVSYANPYKITRALGVILEQSGKKRSTASSK